MLAVTPALAGFFDTAQGQYTFSEIALVQGAALYDLVYALQFTQRELRGH